MSIVLQKGLAYSAEYASTDFPVLSDDWTGSVSLYTEYPGVATLTKDLVRVGNVMTLSITIAEIFNLTSGMYAFVTTVTNAVLGVTITSLVYATVSDVNVSPATKCKLYGTLEKLDGTPAGHQTTVITNTADSTQITLGWKGVDVKVLLPVADADGTNIVGIETVTVTSNAAGYFEVYVLQGLTVTAVCSVFGKSVTINTTGLTTVDLSTYF